MGRKIFVSYKYHDRDVREIPGVPGYTECSDYVNYLRYNILSNTDDMYKGENTDEDLSDKSNPYIERILKAKMYDSSITIVLISPNMKEFGKWESSQWIPWEIQYSLRETTKNGRTSHNNAILGVILPNKSGSYAYFDKNKLFRILKSNIDNGYIHVVEWDYFKSYPNTSINKAIECKNNTPSYKVVKSI